MRWLARAGLLILGALVVLMLLGLINGVIVGLVLFTQLLSDLTHGY